MTSADKLVLVPRPRRITDMAGSFELGGRKYIACRGQPAALLPIARLLQDDLWQSQHLRWDIWAGPADDDPDCAAVLTLDPEADIPDQGYTIVISPARIEVSAATAAGAFYAAMTLRQILRQATAALPACKIDDYPDFPSRGVMLDVTRDKVPTPETLFELVDQLAELKINHFELYFEHAFAYRNHREVWAQASPITGEDILRLDAHCRRRFVELVPNQNSFGHLVRWLRLPRYKHLAECPDGFEWPHDWGHSELPFSLNPTDPAGIAFIEELYDDLLPHFTSRKFNVGCDETHDLGQGKSKAECDKKGKGRVYLEYVLKIYNLLKQRGRTMHFWSDGVVEHPELLPDLPRDVVVLEWGYGLDHPYDQRGDMYAGQGLNFYVCPSTNTYGSIAGRHAKSLDCIGNAAVNGHKHGAIGFLNTDWGNGCMQYLPVSYYTYVAGAAASWCHQTYRQEDLIRSLDLHVFRDSARLMGKIAHGLGNAYLHFDKEDSRLYTLLWLRPSEPLPRGVNLEKIAAAQEDILAAIELLSAVRMNRPDAPLVRDEFANAARFLLHACRRGKAIITADWDSTRTRDALADDLRTILGEHRRLWMARNRPGGLQDNCRPLEERLAELTG